PDPAARAAVRARYGLGTDQPVVVCVSRLVPRKGQDQLVRALPALRARVPGAALLLVGGGPDRDRLTRLARKVGVDAPGVATGSGGRRDRALVLAAAVVSGEARLVVAATDVPFPLRRRCNHAVRLVKSSGRMRKVLTASAFDTALLASSTASCTVAFSCASSHR